MWIASIEDATNIITNLEIRQSIYASGLVFFLYRMCITKYALLRTWYYNKSNEQTMCHGADPRERLPGGGQCISTVYDGQNIIRGVEGRSGV